MTPADGVVVSIGVLVTSPKGSSNGFRFPWAVVVSRNGVNTYLVMLNGSTFRSGFDGSAGGLGVPVVGSSAGLRFVTCASTTRVAVSRLVSMLPGS